MKKILGMVLAAGLLVSAVSAYNPPAGWESMYELSSPTALSGEVTAAGGALYKVGPESLNVNPALTATEQRVVLNLAGTALVSSNEVNPSKIGFAAQTGIMIPTKLYIYSAYINGTFIPFEEMHLGNSLSVKAGLSKSITDWLDVGLGMNTGFALGSDFDWALGADLGFVAKPGNVVFMKDFRYGVSVLDFGKNINKDTEENNWPCWLPVIKGSAAATMYKNDTLKIGAGVDVTVPRFHNMILDASAAICLKEMFTVSISEKINLVETINKSYNFIPSIGMNFKFTFDIKNKKPVEGSDEEYKENKFASYMEKNDWSESEMTVSAAYKNLYKTINAVSVGADINLGLKDSVPPIVKIVFDDDEE